MAPDRDLPPAAPTFASDAFTASSAPPSLTVWLAGPAARALFAPESQSAADLTRWRDIVNTRKREEWQVSRALLAHVRREIGVWVGAAPPEVSGAKASPGREGAFAVTDGVARREGALLLDDGVGAVGDREAFGEGESALADGVAGREGASVLDGDVGAAGDSEALAGDAARISAHTSGDVGVSAASSARDSDVRRAALPSAGSSVQRVGAQSVAPHAPAGVALSLSHSGGYAATAASRVAVRVGVDLECERPRDMTRIARFAFTEHEYAQLEALATADERLERFYILWTLKEAFAKALSLPLLASLRRCTFVNDAGAWRGTVPTESAWVARTFRPSPTLVLSVVALLPERFSPEDLRISTHEWPAPAASAWRTLAALHSGA
jgi:phosphopantetheinyl transferase (holo-ACP synthase)